MRQATTSVVLLPSQTITASGTTGALGIVDMYDTAIVRLSVGAGTGTSPILDVWIQQGFKDVGSADTVAGLELTANSYTVWDDYIHFAQVAQAGGVQFARIFPGTGVQTTVTADAAIGAAQDAQGAGATVVVKAGPIGSVWRVKWVLAGTSPTFPSVYITAQFSPLGA